MNETRIPVKELLQWFSNNRRELPWRQDKEPYHVWLSEIMLQQTRVEAVKGYYARFLDKLPDIESLANCPDDDLLKLWEGLGYYNRARNLKLAATTIVEDYHGIFPREYEAVRSLKGIGDYTAGAVCSICFEQKTPAVDGNVLRVCSRLFGDSDNIDLPVTKKKYTSLLKEYYPDGHCGDFTQALMELGAIVCIPNGIPKCQECPFQECCQARIQGVTHIIPVRSEKRARRQEKKTVFVLSFEDNGKRYYGVRKRLEKGLLSGLFEFYNIDGEYSLQEALDYLSQEGFVPREIEKEIKYQHIFTHVQWDMTAYYVRCDARHDTLIWVTEDEMQESVALPTAFRVFWEAIV